MDSVLLLKKLSERGHSTSLLKLQYCSLKVTYLDHVLSEGQRMLSPERLTLLNSIELLSSLDLCLCCYGLCDESCHTAGGSPVVEWTESMHKAFVDVKTALVSAPAQGVPDYMQPFQLCIREREGFA